MKTLSSISADPRTRIQWPWWGALFLCLVFGVIGTAFLHAGHAKRHLEGTSWCFFTLVLGGALATAARDMSRVPEMLQEREQVPLAIVHRLPPGPVATCKLTTYCTTCWKRPRELFQDPNECCFCDVEDLLPPYLQRPPETARVGEDHASDRA